MIEWLVAFAAMFVTDVCWAMYVNAAKESPLRAAWWAVWLFVLGAIAVVGYTTNHWLLIPSAAGAFAGTYLGVLYARRKES